jgi:predicted RND superfamily exporter protein
VEEQNHAAARGLVRAVETHAAEIFPADWRVELTGTAPLGIAWVDDVQRTQLRSFPTAFALVFVWVAGFLRSARLGLAALVPATVPVVVVLGAMGLAGLSLDVGRAMIAAVVIGIAVDDAIHLLHAYARRRRSGAAMDDAMTGALLETGRPIVVTSLALSLGFLTLTASAWGTVSGFGFFVSLSIGIALLSTLLLLPALVFAAARGAGGRGL